MNLFKNLSLVLLLFGLVTFTSCEKDDNQLDNQTALVENLYKNATTLNIEVVYEENATPITTTGFLNDNAWDFTELNINALFDGRNNAPTINYDKTLADMPSFSSTGKSSYTTQDLESLANQYQLGQNNATEATVLVIFVDGFYNDGTQVREDILGIALTGTFVTAIFKPVITNATNDQDTQKNIEQATVVHEVAHAIGLVNNGVTMTTGHQDSAHGKHCTNTNCLMFWEVEGAQISNFVGGPLFNSNQAMFGQECLDDTQNFNP